LNFLQEKLLSFGYLITLHLHAMLSDLENPSSIFSSQMIESSILSSERNACMAVSSYLLQHVELNAGICVMTHSLLLFAETRHLMDQSTACL